MRTPNGGAASCPWARSAKLLLIFMLYTAFGVLYSKHPFNSFATFLMWMVMFLAYLSMATVLTNRTGSTRRCSAYRSSLG